MDINALTMKLSCLPYFERRLFLSKRIKPNLPRFIYKYRPVYPNDQVSLERLRDILVKSKLWLSSPEDFNDPFDMSAKFILSGTGAEKRKRFYNLAKDNGLKKKEREKFARKMMLASHQELESKFRSIFESHIKNTGVVSFAGDPRNILMWSHYASNHTGICIQFEVSRDIVELSKAIPVNYSLEYPEVNWVTGFEKSLSAVLLRKYDGWRYENEERIVLPGNARQYLMFNASAIRGIVFGCKAMHREKETILEMLKERESACNSPVNVYQAVQSAHQYRLGIYSYTSA